jgi:hypothetical protein
MTNGEILQRLKPVEIDRKASLPIPKGPALTEIELNQVSGGGGAAGGVILRQQR